MIKIYIKNLYLNPTIRLRERRTKSNSHNNNITPPEPSQSISDNTKLSRWEETHPPIKEEPYKPEDPKTRRRVNFVWE